ncbi:putative Citrate-binding protein [Heracleum sosnowskyi]|uniref:Citrate-binding protein n=1 Tax=Heracleum sosnowskyi TaxID=360622 RepID=A0AAD8MFX0_9APIA|nr:putative Citrate-binding protein [Heracleum sosnowskyi]
MSYHYTFLLLIIVSISISLNGICRADPTDGFTLLPLTNDNIKLQKPYNEPLDDRYSFDDGVRKLWVYTNDKPYKQGSPTRPRTEVRINGYDYSSGIWQFEGYAYVPKGTSGFRVNVIHNVDEGELTVYINGKKKYVKNDQGPGDLYFKCGVYAAPAGSSKYMESRWKGIKIYKK